ncbi:hypothetical protein SAMN06265348_103296 [Pedobacter westerhofensis]|uniref:Uncharacterized protein n=1 Tax=Pedobacter westerhofensis TaxID=425512 RepID=A0A521C7R9_9SPHI|nr:hypothetical protein [Pedobacter westerhofensis]SMO55532.1 hypothetical protein SAMN06265348_103296 [Pedobacter westerhofensis]
MKKKYLNYLLLIALVLHISLIASASNKKSEFRGSDYSTTITFPAGFVVGDYVEFLRVQPGDAAAGGYYSVSIAYTRINIAAGATHIASISHSNPSVWREVGRVNNNGYLDQGQNFTIDCNTEYANPRFRIRAVNTLGLQSSPITVVINVTCMNENYGYTPIESRGNDLTVKSFLPMTNEWDLYVGNNYNPASAFIAIKALTNGNVGIGTATPTEKLSVNGNIRAREIKVESQNWPDYVFKPGYKLPPLDEVKAYIIQNEHLSEIPSGKEIGEKGLSLGAMNKLLMKKIEELTLYLIQKDEQLNQQAIQLNEVNSKLEMLNSRLTKIEKK